MHFGRSGYQVPRAPYLFAPSAGPMVKRLLAVTIGCFIAQKLAWGRLDPVLALYPAWAVPRLYLWQFATYIFLHGSVLHLLFNMFVLWMFGRDVEAAMGSRRFLFFYLFCGIGAGFFSYIFYPPFTLIVGSSGAIFGLMVAYAMLFPDRVVTLLILFVLPVQMKAKHLVAVFAGIEFLLLLSDIPGDVVAHFAHLGGGLCGYVYMKCMDMGLRIPARGRVRRAEEYREEIRARVDRVLDKISRSGVGSLSEEERNVLLKARDEL